MAHHGLEYIGQGRWPMAARCPAWSSRSRGIDGRHRWPHGASMPLTTRWTRLKQRRQTGQYKRWRRQFGMVAAMWAMGGHEKAHADTCAGRLFVRADPVLSYIWTGNGLVLSRLSVWIGPLQSLLPIFLSVQTHLDMRCLFGSARWRCPYALVVARVGSSSSRR
jgi:hypothetical protein